MPALLDAGDCRVHQEPRLQPPGSRWPPRRATDRRDDRRTAYGSRHHSSLSGQSRRPRSRYIVDNRAKAKGKKPYFVGEFGFVSTDAFRVFFDTIINEGISGALIWSLRGRSRDGGFYWHSEPLGGDIYKAYHWPGFPTGRGYDETGVLALMQTKAHEIQGIPVPRLELSRSPAPSPDYSSFPDHLERQQRCDLVSGRTS